MKRRALITGITGFIGGALARRLARNGWHVDSIVRSHSAADSMAIDDAVVIHRVDDGQDLAPIVDAARPDVVFHLASLYLAEHRPDQVADLIASNILFPARLTEAMAACGVRRMVNTGTAWQHDEAGAYRPVNLYAATKQAFHDLLAYEHDARGLSVTTLKLFDTYGPGDTRRKLIRILIDSAGADTVLDMSPGEQVVDLTHIDDVVRAFEIAADRLLALETPVLDSFFVAGERMRVRDLVDVVGQALGEPVNVRFGGRPYRPREVMTLVAPHPQVPGWTPGRSLIESLPDMRG